MLAIRRAASYSQRGGADGHPDHGQGLVGDPATADQHSEEFRTPAPWPPFSVGSLTRP